MLMIRSSKRLVALVVALGLTLAAPRANAGPEAASGGAALEETAGELVRTKRYEEAVVVYDKAYALTQDAALLYNRGRALEYLARYPEALASIEAFAKDAPPELRAKVPGLSGKLDELRSKTTRLTVRCAVPGARVVLGDRVLGTTPLSSPIIVTSGRLGLEVSAEGYFTSQRAVELPGGGDVSIDVALASKTRTAIVVVKSPVAGASVSLDGKSAGASPAELVVTPG